MSAAILQVTGRCWRPPMKQLVGAWQAPVRHPDSALVGLIEGVSDEAAAAEVAPAAAEEADGEVCAVIGDLLVLLVRLLGDYSVAPVYLIHGYLVHLAICPLLLWFLVLTTIGLVYSAHTEPTVQVPDGCN